jgi:hypothetical protein
MRKWLGRLWSGIGHALQARDVVDFVSRHWGQLVWAGAFAAGSAIWGVLSDLSGLEVFVLAGVVFAVVLNAWNALLERKIKMLYLAEAVTQGPVRPVATAEELAMPYLDGRTIRVGEVPREDLHFIRGKTWVDCTLEGPAVLEIAGNVIEDLSIPVEIESMLWTPSGDYVVGVIGLQHSVLRRCRLEWIGLTGSEQVLSDLETHSGPRAEAPERRTPSGCR